MSEITDPMFAGVAEPDHCPGPWVYAAFDGECSRAGDEIARDDEIRADGDGGWEHRECVEHDQGDEREAIGQAGWDDDHEPSFNPELGRTIYDDQEPFIPDHP